MKSFFGILATLIACGNSFASQSMGQICIPSSCGTVNFYQSFHCPGGDVPCCYFSLGPGNLCDPLVETTCPQFFQISDNYGHSIFTEPFTDDFINKYGTNGVWTYDCTRGVLVPPQRFNDSDDDDPCEHEDGGEDDADTCSACSPQAMPRWHVSEPYLSLWIKDEPLWYQPGLGPRIAFDLAFKQQEQISGYNTNIFGIGRKWNFSWLSYITLDIFGNPVVQFGTGGGHSFTNGLDYLTNTRLTGDTNAGFSVTNPDGSTNFFTFIVTNASGTFLQAFLTASSNPFGQQTRFYYAGYTSAAPVVRLLAVVDGDGLTNSISYVSSNPYSSNLISQVGDPFGRYATLLYDNSGHLTNITDVGGITSSFVYDSNEWVTSLITPYGTNQFKISDSVGLAIVPNGRSIEITEPDGGKELYLFTNNAPGVPSSYSSNQVPNLYPYTASSLDTNRLDVNNSFHWNKLQYPHLGSDYRSTGDISKLNSSDFLLARMKHWLSFGPDTNFVSQILSMERRASPDGSTEGQKTWYDYAGKTNSGYIGSQSRPLFDAMVLPDGSTRFSRTDRNAFGLVTTNVTTYSAAGSVAIRTETFTYVNGIDLQTVTNAMGVQTSSNLFNTYHQVKTNYNARGEMTIYTYNANQQVSTVTIPSGLVTSNYYFPSGSSSNRLNSTFDYIVISGTNSYYRTNSYTWANALIATKTDPMNLTLTYTWDNLQRLRRVDYPDGTCITNFYINLDLVQVIDRMKFTNSLGYDRVQHLIEATNANGAITRYGYCSCGALLYLTNAFGTPIQQVTQYLWDFQGHRIMAIQPDTNTLTFNYNAIGQLTNVTDGLVSVVNTFNNQGLLISSSNAYGQVLAIVYDILDRTTNIVDANAVTITNTFDNLNRLLTRGYPDKGVEQWGYTLNVSGPTSYMNQVSNIVNYAYDPLGRKTAELYLGVTTNQFAYNGPGNLLTLTDGKSQVTTWNYDQYGRVSTKVDAAGSNIFIYRYDANDRLTNRWTPAKGGITTLYGYDRVGNLTNIAYPTSSNISLAYDLLNRLTDMVDAVGTSHYTYTSGNLLLTEDGPWPDDTVSYSYNYQRLRTGLSLLAPNSSPWVQTYGYDVAERLTNVTSPAGVFGYTLGGSGAPSPLIKKLALPNGAYITNSYDSVARVLSTLLKSSGNTVINSHVYGYNVAGQRTAMTNTVGDYRNYGYDNVGRLTSASGFEADAATRRLHEQLQYAYDPTGNLNSRINNDLVQTFNVNVLNELTNVSRSTNMTVAGTTTSQATSVTVNGTNNASLYADATFACTNVGLMNGTNTLIAIATDSLGRRNTNSSICNLPSAISYSYDQNGNILNDGSRYFTYDDENQLTSVVVTNNGGTSTRSDFVYDGKMRCRIRVEYSWGGVSWITNEVVKYAYDRNLVIQERDGNNVPAVSYTLGTDLSGSLQGAGGVAGLLARTDSHLLADGDSASHAYYHADASGNITVLINKSQSTMARYTYDPFARIVSSAGLLADVNLYRFSSKEFHRSLNLAQFLYRWYDPDQQRWINRDPIGEDAGSINLYAFVANNPLSYVDVNGLSLGDWIRGFSQGWSDAARSIGQSLGGSLAAAYDAYLGNPSLVNGDLNYAASGIDTSQPAYDAIRGFDPTGLLPADPNDPNAQTGLMLGMAASWLTGQGEVKAAVKGGAKAVCKARSKFPPALRKFYNTMKRAYDAAKRAGKGNEPVKHTNDPNQPPHYHPADDAGNQTSHDHYYFPGRYK